MGANEKRVSTDGSARLAEMLRVFRATHTKQTLQVGSDAWEYFSGGGGERTIVIVGGGGSTAESMFSVNAALESCARVVSLGIPPTVTTAEQTAEGIRAILDALGVRQAILLGHSLGGMAVQCFAACHPERVAGLVLSNTGFYLGVRGKLLPGVAGLVGRAPGALLIRTVTRQMNRLLKSVEGGDFWREFTCEELSLPNAGERLRKQFALMAGLLRFFRNNPILSTFSWVQSMPVQIISSEDDKGFTKQETEFLRRLYPRSQTTIFPKGTGHLSFLTRPKEYVEVVRRFMAGVDRDSRV